MNRYVVGLLTGLALVTALAQAQAVAGPRENVAAASGLVLSADGTVVFVPGPDGKVAAVSVADGKELWQRANVPHLLGWHDNRLLVIELIDPSKNTVKLVALDPASGKALASSDVFSFRSRTSVGSPDQVGSAAAEGSVWSPVPKAGYFFGVKTHVGKDARLYVGWNARKFSMGGAPMTSLLGGGTTAVSLMSGKVNALGEGENAPADAVPLIVPERQPAAGIRFTMVTRSGNAPLGAISMQSFLRASGPDGKPVWERPYGQPLYISVAP